MCDFIDIMLITTYLKITRKALQIQLPSQLLGFKCQFIEYKDPQMIIYTLALALNPIECCCFYQFVKNWYDVIITIRTEINFWITNRLIVIRSDRPINRFLVSKYTLCIFFSFIYCEHSLINVTESTMEMYVFSKYVSPNKI